LVRSGVVADPKAELFVRRDPDAVGETNVDDYENNHPIKVRDGIQDV
jgi:hypothetical protein